MKSKSIAVVAFFTLFLCLLTANKAGATNYTLTVVTQGSGTIYRNPTNTVYPSGVTVTINGVANPGWYFANWTGDTNSSLNPLNVVMNSNMVVTGSFLAYPTYTLSLVTNGQGGIALSPSGGSYLSNTVVTATATTAAGWAFAGWSGVTNSSVNPVSFAVNTSGTLTGTFAQLPAFDVQPVSVTNKAGSTVSFTSHAQGTALNYQWYFSGGSLTGDNNATLSLTSVSTGQAGTYWVVATNNYGSATSQVVSLTLTNSVGPTNVVISPNQANLLAAIAQGGWVGFGFNGTLTLTNTILITNSVVLDGSGVTAIISGGSAVQLFYVTNGASLTISNLTLANGNSTYGAAIFNNTGVVVVVGCLLTNNQAFWGGAIHNSGGATVLSQSVFLNNIAAGSGCQGGAVYQSSGSMMISNCNFSFNSAQNTGNGIFGANGGALAFNGGNISIDRSQFLENKATGIGPYEESGCPAAGGAVYTTATLAVNDSSFAGNQAIADGKVVERSPGPSNGSGGAIYNAGTALANRCSFYTNYVQGGYATPFENLGATGGPAYGGSICNASYFAATNCTVALNSAIAGGAGAVFVPASTNGTAMGGGIYNNPSGTFIAMNLTIASNTCSSSPGQDSITGIAVGSQIANATNGMLRLHNSLIAGTNSNAYGPITDDGYNICSDGSANFSSGSSYNYTDPQLAALGYYGGPTLCMALLPTSPAIDNGDINGCPNTDQRGFLRPFGSGPDMGAYEYGSAASTVPYLNMSVTTTNVSLSFSAFPVSTYYLQWSTNLTTWANLSTNGPFAVSTFISQSVSRQGVKHCFFRLLLQ